MNYATAIQALADAEVEFVIIGGWSAILHGSAYVTKDLDICFDRQRANLRRLVIALAPFHPRLRGLPEGVPFVWDEATLYNGTIFTLDTDLGMVDLLAELPGVGTYETVRANSELFETWGRRVRVLDLPTLIKSKRAAGRPKDLSLIPELESLQEAKEE